MYVAACLLHIPGVTVSIFSTGRRASSSLTDLVKKWITAARQSERIVKCNMEQLFLCHDAVATEDSMRKKLQKALFDPDSQGISRLFSYPSSSTGLRGMGGDILIIEEAAFISPDVFKNAILPMLGVNHTACLAISTPSDDDNNLYTRMFQMKDDKGNPLFYSIDVGLICKACLESGDDRAKRCSHNSQRLPSWKSGSRMNRMKAILKNDMDAFARENLGAMISNSDYVFDRSAILRLDAREPHAVLRPPAFVHIAIDPAGGGTLSDYCIMSMVHVPSSGTNVIVGMDTSASKKQHEIDNLIRRHFAGLRRHPFLSEAIFIVYVEANMSWLIPNQIESIVCSGAFGSVVMDTTLTKGSKELLTGVLTTNANKRLYAEILQACILEDTLVFSLQCVSQAFAENKNKLIEQLRNYRREIKEPNDLSFGTFRESYTGKAKGQKDDMCLCIQLLMYWRAEKLKCQIFHRFCRRNNLRL